ESPAARLLGRYWSYLNYAEHVTVFCPDSMRTWLQRDFSAIELARTDHHSTNWLTIIRMWMLFPLKGTFRKVWPGCMDMHAALSLPCDHMLVRAIRDHTTEPDVGLK